MSLKLPSPASPYHPIHHQHMTWWDPWPRTCLSIQIGHLGVLSKSHGFVWMASGKHQLFHPKCLDGHLGLLLLMGWKDPQEELNLDSKLREFFFLNPSQICVWLTN